MKTIQVLTQDKETTYVEVESTKPIDKEELQRLLDSQTPEVVLTELKDVIVRCDRWSQAKPRWVICEPNGREIQRVECMVMMNVTLRSIENGVGCGGSEYTGVACGKQLKIGQPVSVPNDHIRQLGFDNFEGNFFDKDSGDSVNEVDYLVLMPDCKHKYIHKAKD